MPLLDEKTLIGLPVYTERGTHLGKTAGFDVDADSHLIRRYRVKPRGLAARMIRTPLLVAREQVLSVDAEKMVVEESVGKEMALAQARAIGLVGNAKA